MNRNVGLGEMFNGLLNNLVRSVCFESFLNNLGFEETQLGWTDVNFEGAQHKKKENFKFSR